MVKSHLFVSQRLHKAVYLVMTFNQVHYIIEGYGPDTVISIERDSCWHLNQDGFLRAADYFDDPRFDYWTTNNK